jgi:DNA-binding HxlR family transcriptional regulator
MRYRALARRLGAQYGDRIEDNSLSRTLGRLRRTGLITAQGTLVGRRTVPLYRITDQGRRMLATYHALVHTYQQQTSPHARTGTPPARPTLHCQPAGPRPAVATTTGPQPPTGPQTQGQR